MAATERLDVQDSFCRQFTATVLACEQGKGGWALELNRSAFFPEGGGQPCDLGVLEAEAAKAQVLDVRVKEGRVLHTVDAPLPVGAAVRGKLDWERRRDAMEQHTGEHILSGTLHRLYGAENVGFHIGPDVVRMDLSLELTAAQLAEAERQANALIRENVPVRAWYPAEEELAALAYRSKKEIAEALRLVEIPGGDLCACCGTHLAFTGQVGLIKILSAMNYKGGTRLAAAAGQRAFAQLAAEHEALVDVGQALSVPPLGVPAAVERVAAGAEEQKLARVRAENRWFQAVAARQTPGQPAVLLEEELAGDALRRLAICVQEKTGALAAVFSPATAGLAYVLAAGKGDVRPLCKALNARFAGRGGGKTLLCQGSLTEQDFAQIKAFFAEALSAGAEPERQV